MNEIPNEQRTEILKKAMLWYLQQGYHVVSQTDYSVQLLKPKQFSCLIAIIGLILVGIGLLLYIFWYMAQKDQRVYLEVDKYGVVVTRRS